MIDATSRRRIAWILILIVDLGYAMWGAGAALSPDGLVGPGGKAILPAGYEGYTGSSWPALASSSPAIAGYMTVLFRTYGVHCVVFGVLGSVIAITAFRRGETWAWWALLVANSAALISAMTYDKTVNAIGPFEITEYLGLALVWGALLVTAPFGVRSRPRSAAA